MNVKDFDNYIRNYTDEESNNISNNFALIKNDYFESDDIGEIPCFYSGKLSFIKHNRFSPMTTHKHKFIEMSYVYSGEVNEVVNGVPLTLKKGDLIILDTNVTHSIDITGSNDIMLNFPINKEYFNNSFFNQLDSDNIVTNFLLHSLYESQKYNSYLIFHTKENEFINNIICKLAQEFIEPNINSSAVIDSCLIILFSELLRIYDTEEKTKGSNDVSKQTRLSIDIINYISSNYETITLASAAEYFHFTPNYFSNIAKKYTGKNFKDLILDEKLKKASYLLRNTTLPIEKVIEKVGITNIQFFYKKFKDQYGVTPYKYRKP